MLDAIAPTTVTLPGGLVLEADHPLHTAELRPLTGREEDWLVHHPSVPSATAVTCLLSNCLLRLDTVTSSRELVGKLLVGDRDYLVLQLRRLTLGDEFRAVVLCPQCQAPMDVTFHAEEIPVETRRQTASHYSCHLPSRAAKKRAVRYRLPTGSDQEAVLGLDPVAGVDALLERCLLDPVRLTRKERQLLMDEMEKQAPSVELDLNLQCPNCSHAFIAPFDTTAFFLQEIRSGARHLLREFHTLAFHYHWSEAEILRLERSRRRTYLSLVSDELQRN